MHNLAEELGTALLPTMNKFLGVGFTFRTGYLTTPRCGGVRRAWRGLALRAGVHAIGELITDVNKVADRFLFMEASEETAGAGLAELGAAADGTGIQLAAAGDMGVVAGDEIALGADAATVGWDMIMTATVIGLVFLGLIALVEHWHAV